MAVEPALRQLGVVFARAVEGVRADNDEPVVLLGKTGGFSTGPGVLNDVCESEVRKNAKKLGEHGHLFVWVESIADQAWVGMDLDRPPSDRPDVPAGLTIWLARKTGGAWQPDLLWRVSPD